MGEPMNSMPADSSATWNVVQRVGATGRHSIGRLQPLNSLITETPRSVQRERLARTNPQRLWPIEFERQSHI